MDEYNERNEGKGCDCEKHEKHYMHHQWIKFALLLVAVFLACYLAVYYILDQMRHSYYIPVRMDSIDNILEEQDKLFSDMRTFPMHYNAMMVVKSPVETYKDDENDAYKVVIDLRQFNNDPNNITVDVAPHKVAVSGIEDKKGKNKEDLYSFSQSFVLPQKIEVDKVTKDKVKNKYVITLPIVDEEDYDLD